jgi:hydrogenase maturation protein HypF
MAPRPILAVGGQQKSAIALWTGKQALLSPHIGDLDSLETRAAFVHLIQSLTDLYGSQPQAVACDLHPDYFTTRWAEEQALPLVRVQHHHAHAAAVMAEHGLLDAEVVAFTWDGTGYGPDGTVWGGEVLRAKLERFERVASLQPFRLPGGEAAIRAPARVTLALLVQAFGEEAVLADTDLLGRLQLKPAETRVLLQMIARNICSPWTTSVGRLFDAVAALLLPLGRISYEGEAAVCLESLADRSIDEAYRLEADATGRADASRLLQTIREDVRQGTPAAVIAGRFHQWLAAWAAFVAERHPDLPVVLGGGCFQNRLLLERTKAMLERAGRRVYHASRVPPGDGGLAVGQLAVALARVERE